jgi:hypothetical protein
MLIIGVRSGNGSLGVLSFWARPKHTCSQGKVPFTERRFLFRLREDPPYQIVHPARLPQSGKSTEKMPDLAQPTVADPVKYLVEARWIIRKTVQQEYRVTAGWAVLEIGDSGDSCPNRFPSGRTILDTSRSGAFISRLLA